MYIYIHIANMYAHICIFSSIHIFMLSGSGLLAKGNAQVDEHVPGDAASRLERISVIWSKLLQPRA